MFEYTVLFTLYAQSPDEFFVLPHVANCVFNFNVEVKSRKSYYFSPNKIQKAHKLIHFKKHLNSLKFIDSFGYRTSKIKTSFVIYVKNNST
jgi:hypothetical protein